MITLHVTGMSCQHCVDAVKNAVGAVDAAARVEIDLAAGRVAIESGAEARQLARAIEDAGYEVNG